MKDIKSFEVPVGGDGAVLSGDLNIDAGNLNLKLQASYPLDKFLTPVEAALDGALNKLKSAIPGDWDDKIIEEFKIEYKAKLVALLGQV